MGQILKSTPEMGEYEVEVRSESFYLRGEDSFNGPRDHALFVYPDDCGQGTVEIPLEDIAKIRACLNRVERYMKDGKP